MDLKSTEFAFSCGLDGISAGATSVGSAGQPLPCTSSSLSSLIFKYANASEEPFKFLPANRSEGLLSF